MMSNASASASAAGNKRPAAAASEAVDLTAPDLSDHDPEQLSPTKDVANPYKKSKPDDLSVSSTAPASAPAPVASSARPSIVTDLTLPETGSDEEVPEMLKPEAVPEKQKCKQPDSSAAAKSAPASASAGKTASKGESKKTAAAKSAKSSSSSSSGEIPGPIRPRKVPPLRSNPFDRTGPRWSTYEGKLLIRTAPPVSKPKPTDAPTKVAAFDMDGTILLTLGVRHASNFGDLQLWSSTVIDKIRSLHDNEGCRLVLITNQGGIQTQLDGKKAMFIRSVIDWLAHEIDRPFNAVVSCSKTNGFHKPLAGMWSIAEQKFNGGQEFDLRQSFYVGDSIPGDSQGGVDMAFAANVGEMRNGVLKFYQPEEFWGCPSDYERRCAAQAAKVDAESYEAPPPSALRARAALCGGYLCTKRPILLQLMGVQGSGKSTFCQTLLETTAKKNGTGQIWTHLSQDTINGGRPGKRDAVERTALEQLRAGKCVIIDRMHLGPEQRAYFVNIASQADASCHLLWFDVPKTIIERRVRSRTNHAGGVEGDAGARMAVQSLSQVVTPLYAEGFDLISRVRSEEEVKTIASSYGKLRTSSISNTSPDSDCIIPSSFTLKVSCGEEKNKVTIPSVALGTMNMGKRVATNLVSTALSAGFRAVDTAPTYKNEEEVGDAIKGSTSKPFITVKVPKSAVSPEEVRTEVTASLKRLGIDKADLIILHWPCDFIENKTLGPVWNELESMASEGLASALGVSNFSVGALRVLLPLCRTHFPSVNQVERHPLLPQWDLVDYCANKGILLQAHTALAQGKVALLQHPKIMSIAQASHLSVPDMLLRWNLSQGVAVVTKSSSYERQKAAASEMRLLPPTVLEELDTIGRETKPHRFIDPPFMYRPGAPWAWGIKM